MLKVPAEIFKGACLVRFKVLAVLWDDKSVPAFLRNLLFRRLSVRPTYFFAVPPAHRHYSRTCCS